MTNTINEADLEWTEYDRGSSRFRRKQLSSAADATELGCSLYELAAGDRSWPYHYHTANEEAIFVLEGEGTLRCEERVQPLEAGDFAAFPATRDGGHRIVNDGDGVLRYLLVSTMVEPDVTVYPEMGKIGVFIGAPPGGQGERSLHGYYRLDEDVEYWEE
jgi:uncharacterized cupin superfamily protein